MRPSDFVNYLGQGRIMNVPVPVIIMLVLASLFLKYTILGRQVYAVGSNAEAARLSGVNVKFIQVMVYTITRGMCAIAGFISAGLTGVGATNAGVGNELDVIAAVIIGGTSLSGGEGTILGAVIGAAIMAVIKNAFVLLHLPIYMQTISIGLVIIIAVAIDSIRIERASKQPQARHWPHTGDGGAGRNIQEKEHDEKAVGNSRGALRGRRIRLVRDPPRRTRLRFERVHRRRPRHSHAGEKHLGQAV